MKAAVIGAGIMGRLLALNLLNDGWQVTIYDQSNGSNCSQAAAGLLTPVSELDKAELIIHHLGVEGLNTHWPAILEQLSTPIYFQRKGCLVVHHPQDLTEWQQFSSHIGSKLGHGFYQHIQQDDLHQLEPDLTKLKSAYFIPEEGQIDNQAVLVALEHYLIAEGVDWQANTQVASIKPGQVILENASQSFDMVFDARGMGAKSSFPDLRGLRGELIWLQAPEVQLQRPVRFLHPRYSLYIVPRPNHHYLLGASEIEADDYSEISVRSALELLTAAYYVHAGFAEARIIKTVTHCRPTLHHHLPRIKFANQFIAVNGLYRHGYLIAPTIAQEIVNGLKQKRQYPELWEEYHDNNLH